MKFVEIPLSLAEEITTTEVVIDVHEFHLQNLNKIRVYQEIFMNVFGNLFCISFLICVFCEVRFLFIGGVWVFMNVFTRI